MCVWTQPRYIEYVCYGVQLGVSNVDDLSQVLNSREEQQEKEAKKKEIRWL